MDKNDILNYALENGIINVAELQMQCEEMKQKEYLKLHPYSIFENSGYWWSYLPNEEKGRIQIKKKRKEDLEKLIIDFYREDLINPTIKEIYNEWNNYRLSCGDISIATYDRTNDYYKRHFKEIEKIRIKYWGVKDWAMFLKNQVAEKSLKKKAYNGLHQLVFSLLKYAKMKDLIDFRISEIDEHISFGKYTFRDKDKIRDLENMIQDTKEVFSEEEVEKILTYLVSHLDAQNVGLLLTFLTGMRIGEVAALKKVFVRDEGIILVRHSETKHRDAKTNKYVYEISEVKTDAGYRDIVLPKECEWLCRVLKELNSDSEFVFTNKNGRMTTNCFRRRQEQVCKHLGIPYKPPHKNRKTYATILSDLGFDENFIIRQLGHTNIKTTEEFYHRDRKTTEKKAEMLGQIHEFNILKRKAIV